MAHHLFSIPELCAAIIEFVIVEPGRIEDDYEYWMPMDPASSPTLAPLASVSSIFKEPALDALWRRLKDIYPLARLLPRDVVCLKDGIWKLVGNHDIEVHPLPKLSMNVSHIEILSCSGFGIDH